MKLDLNGLRQAKTPFEFLDNAKPIIDSALTKVIERLPTWEAAEQMSSIVQHATFAGGGGKRLRPALTLLTARCCGTPLEEVIDCAAAVELIHAYTLIIDDIQDGDDIRRGEPATHSKFGINLSLLAASVLLIEGTSLLQEKLRIPPLVLRELLHKLHAGQEADIESANWPVPKRTQESMQFIFSGKTGALFGLSCVAGLGAQGADEEMVRGLVDIGSEMGIVFQAVDDLLEATGDSTQTGKPVRKDRAQKLTFMSLFADPTSAREEIQRRRVALEAKIRESLPGEGAGFLIEFLEALVHRSR
ncbi:polyprenyl synthetase family protein [Bradyrhizobium sp. HKCCYLRH3061]|uniref:polyprenyl synthetase family protein n=1 Tax=Bradyrhizobium sp. HKCCYLRH3061 TaxID=3420734 RepID=UPI003EB6E95A